MKRFAFLLLLLPSLAFGACPVLTGTYHCVVKKLDLNIVSNIDIRIENTDNGYALSTTKPGVDPITYTADGVERGYVVPIPDGLIYHTSTASCEDGKFHLFEIQKWYHDINFDQLTPETLPAKIVSISELLSLDANGNLVREDTWTKASNGEVKTEVIPLVCPKIEEKLK